jgi:hypothetical protein
MYYHYWFHGKRFLELPVNELLKQKKPDFPFCICWANETWTRVWAGNPNEVIMQQEYSLEDDIKHMEYLCREVFSDERYIKVNGKPLMGVWEVNELPNAKKTSEIWQEIAIKNGFQGLYLINVDHFSHIKDPELIGFDAVTEFVPDWGYLPNKQQPNLWENVLNYFNIQRSSLFDHRVYNYEDFIKKNIARNKPEFKYFPCCTPSWDNTSRRIKDASILHGSTPELFEYWITEIVKKFRPYSDEENFIFINAWNEWAEGAHLEPCAKWGHGYLEALKHSLEK